MKQTAATQANLIPGTIVRPHPRQWQVLSCPADEILYGGAAGSGKTRCQIFDYLSHHAKYGAVCHGLLLRRTMAELTYVIRETLEILSSIDGKFKYNSNDHIFTFDDGAILQLGYLDSFNDVFRYQGHQYLWMGWDELTQWPEDDAFIWMKSRLRAPIDPSGRTPRTRILATTNPGGVGHGWVMARYQIGEHPNGLHPIIETIGDKTYTRIFIPGRLEDNPTLDIGGDYRAMLSMLPDTTRKMLLDGRWDVVEGAFLTEWDPKAHICRAFTPPATWLRFLAGDWGTFAPHAMLWATLAPDGRVYVYRELYGYGGKPNKGNGEHASVVAAKIRTAENAANEAIRTRWLDSSCFANHGHDLSIADIFRRDGVPFAPSFKPQSKAAAIAQLREFMKVVNGQSRLVFMDTCVHAIRTIPTLQVDRNNPDVWDQGGEDHAADACLYLVNSMNHNQGAAEAERHAAEARAHRYDQPSKYGLL